MKPSTSRFVWFALVPLVISVAGGIIGVKYAQAATPHADIVADGSCVSYWPEPSDLAPNPFERTFCTMLIRNNGNRRAESVRLRVLQLIQASVAGKPVGGWGAAGPQRTIDLATLEAGDQVNVDYWAVASVAQAFPVVSHSEGPGATRIRTVPDRLYFLNLNFDGPFEVIVTFIILGSICFLFGNFIGARVVSRKSPASPDPSAS